MSIMKCLRTLLAGVLALFVAACGGPDFSGTPEGDMALVPPPAEYQLGPGDKLNVLVFGQPDLSGLFPVDGTGNIAMPLVGQIPASGQTLPSMEKLITARLADGYIREPRVTVQLAEGRPFFVVGAVKNPGPYPFAEGTTAVTAVATAGGYTDKSRQGYVLITRGNDPERREFMAPMTTPVMADDIVRVPETFF